MFSIVVPTFNSEQFIATTLEKVCGQITERFEVEIIVVDDCSTDGTYELLLSLSEQEPKLKVVQLEQNGGPGYARNKGVEFAKHPWILFLDSDDAYSPHALETLYEHLIHNKDADIVCFDWEYDADSTSTMSGYEGRDDLSFIAESDKPDLIQAYLLNRIDPSVIYSVFRKDFLIENVLIFREGFHEDVDYMFIALLKAINISIFDKKLYLKNHRPESIVNTFSAKHIEGYFAALKAIAEQLKNHDEQTWRAHKSSFSQGLVNIVASRITRIFTFKVLERSAESLIFLLKKKVHALCHDFGVDVIHYQPEQKNDFKTKYQMIFDFFISQVDEVHRSGVEALQQYIESIRNKSWSCYDLHHSVFFAPDEIRTCCKRFFADGEMKGDVVLLDGASQHNEAGFSFDEIQTAKKQLHKEINRDNAPECSGCPFLHFEDWGQPLNQGIKYLSLEYHSVCNMKCTYCSDTYYGGEKAKYDVQKTVDSLIDKGALDKAEYIVWGGGEPILDKAFEPILETISDAVASVKQRVITNATRYSEPLASLMKEDKAYIVTSIDAGTLDVFKEVRQYPRMGKVLENVKAYAKDAAHNVIIKYIFLPNNQSIEELKAFVTLMVENDLTNCNF
jgi:glycosyltransferase involved in cell wall biosynthesis/organic radical activating enzyme